MAADTLTPEDAAHLDVLRAELRDDGYVDIEQHVQLRIGTRVCHRGHRWPDAILDGTGVVLALTERPDSSWSRSWGAADIELIVAWDKPQPFGSRLSQLAQYHVQVAINQPQEGSTDVR